MRQTSLQFDSTQDPNLIGHNSFNNAVSVNINSNFSANLEYSLFCSRSILGGLLTSARL